MYSRPEQLMEHYSIHVKSFAKGRDCYLFETGQETVALHEYFGSKERAIFLLKMLQHLKEQGLLVECVYQTTEGEVLVLDEEEKKYILTQHYKGAECETSKEEDMLAAVKQLAKLHLYAKSYEDAIPEMLKRKKDAFYEPYERHNKELIQTKNYIRGKKKKNAFEELLFQQCDPFYKKALQVTKALKEIKLQGEAYGFCHGDFNQHSIVFAKTGIAIVGLERFTYDYWMKDLANFIRKMMEKNNWNLELGRNMIAAYTKIRPISEEEGRLLYCYLAYPEKFWKLANHYKLVHKAWLSERNIEKLKRVITQEDKKEQFLEGLKK